MRPLVFLWRIWPAIRAAIKEIDEALREDSPGGKKLTKEEALQLAAVVTSKLRDPIADLILKRGR